jgi:hypothetical protein
MVFGSKTCYDFSILEKRLKFAFEKCFNNMFDEIWLSRMLYDFYKFDIIHWDENYIKSGMVFEIGSLGKLISCGEVNKFEYNDLCQQLCGSTSFDELHALKLFDHQHIVTDVMYDCGLTIIHFQTIRLDADQSASHPVPRASKNKLVIVRVRDYYVVRGDYHSAVHAIRCESPHNCTKSRYVPPHDCTHPEWCMRCALARRRYFG